MSALNISTIVANVFICLSCVFAVLQVHYMRKSILADHERRKKQSTIEFYNDINQETDKLQKQFREHIKTDRIAETMVENEKYKELIAAIRRYLSLMERFSVGVNTGVYDIDVFSKIAGHSTIKQFRKLYDYIDIARKQGSSYEYSDFEKMVRQLEKIYKPELEQKDSLEMRYS